MHPCHAYALHTELPEGWYGAGAVDQGALEVHGHVAGKPGRPARLAALPAAHPSCRTAALHGSPSFSQPATAVHGMMYCTCGLRGGNARQSSGGPSCSRDQHGSTNNNTDLTSKVLLTEQCLWGGPGQRTYCITAACCKQVRVEGANCEGVDGHPGLNNPCLLLPLISCTRCFPISPPDLLMGQHSWPCCSP